jgi:hypothetical protein
VLVASSLLLLAVVSAIVAFRGWPDTGFAENVGSVFVDEAPRVEVDGPVQLAQNASPAAAAVADTPAPGTAAAGGPTPRAPLGSVDVRSLPVARGPAIGVPVGGGGGNFRDDGVPPPTPDTSPPTDLPQSGLLPVTPISPQVNQITQGLGDTTQRLTDGLGGTVGELNPQLGQTLTDTGRVLSELVRGLGRPRQ